MAKKNKNLTELSPKNNSLVGELAKNREFNNFDVSFQLYEEQYQEIKIKSLKKEHLEEFEKLILEILKCKNEKELGRINRGKTNPRVDCRIRSHHLKDEMIHLGKERSKFRLHGILHGMSFKIICIDPEHNIHKIK